MGNMARATKEIKKNKQGQVLDVLAQQVDYNSNVIYRLSVRFESLLKILLDKNIITKEEFDNEIKKAVEEMNQELQTQIEEEKTESQAN